MVTVYWSQGPASSPAMSENEPSSHFVQPASPSAPTASAAIEGSR